MPAQQAPNILEVSANKQKKLSQLASHIRSTAIFFYSFNGRISKIIVRGKFAERGRRRQAFFQSRIVAFEGGRCRKVSNFER